MDKASVKDIMKNPTMSRTDQNPSKAAKLTMSDNGCSDEILSPKSRIVRGPKMNIKRTVTFTESASSLRSPNKSIALVQVAVNDTMMNSDNGEIGGNDEMLHKEVSRLKKLVANGMERRKKENIKHEKVVEYMVEKGNSFEAEIEDLAIKLKIARESEEEFKVKYIGMKTKLSKANSQVTMLTENSKNYDWEMQLIKAQLSGAEARDHNGSTPTNSESHLRDKVKLQNELDLCKGRIEVLEADTEGDQRIIKTLERNIATQKKELTRLNMADVNYLNLLETHHGGSLKKYQQFMKTANLATDCSDLVIERWRKLNSWKLDEGDMLLLTKLIVSERVIRSKAIIIDFLKSSLEFEPNVGELGEAPNAPTKKEKDESNFLLMTPEKIPKKKKSNQNPSAYQDAYKRHILLTHETNRTDIYSDLQNFPDLWEEGHGRTEPEYTWLDLSQFENYRNEDNDKAIVVRSAAGGYLSMSNCLSQRRHCFPHQFNFIKPCEIPGCSRFLFPQSHVESELIGRVHWISGANTMMLTQNLKVREFGVLFGCKLCVLRSQSSIKARQLLKDLKSDVEMKRARDAADRQVKGISEVPAVKDNVTEAVFEKHDDGAAGIEDNDESEADLLSACSPQRLVIRPRPVLLSKPERVVNKIAIKKSLLESYPSISIKRVSDVPTCRPTTQDPGHPSTISIKPTPRETRTYATENELSELFAVDSMNLANSLTKNSLMKNVKGPRSRVTGVSISPNSKELIDDNHLEDYNGEVFSSGSETFEDQMREIRDEFTKKQVDDARVVARNDAMDNTREVAKAAMKDNNMVVRNRVGSMNDIVMTNSERLVKQDEEASENVAGQDGENSQSSNKQTEITSESSDEQDEVDRDVFVQMNNEMLSDSHISDEEVRNESDSSLVLNDAQSLGIRTDDDGDDDVDIDIDDDVEGYVPLPMSEEQVSDQLSEQRDSGDFE